MRSAQHWRLLAVGVVGALVVTVTLGAHGTRASAAEPAWATVASTSPLSSKGWTVIATSAASLAPASYASDGSVSTYWQSRVGAVDPSLTLDMRKVHDVAGLRYTPPPAGRAPAMTAYEVDTSLNGTAWSVAATGAFDGSIDTQVARFARIQARYVRLTATKTGAKGVVGAAEVRMMSPSAVHNMDSPAPHPDWAASSDSAQAGDPPTNVIDGDTSTQWLSDPDKSLPHSIQIDTGADAGVYSSLTYVPPQDGDQGIGNYRVYTSIDGTNYTLATSGSLPDDSDEKRIEWPAATARYIELYITSAAGGGNVVGASEIMPEAGIVPATATPAQGSWSAPINFPIVPAAVALLPNGKILGWSADEAQTYGGAGGNTHTMIYDPATGDTTVVTANTGQDMFCPGVAQLADGRLAVFGGHLDDVKVSVYDGTKNTWSAALPMSSVTGGRGYESAATQSDGSIFVIGGSFDDGNSGPDKNGEVWTGNPSTSRYLPDALVSAMLTQDEAGKYRQDNHGWLFSWGKRVFQAGPSKQMNWYSTAGDGTVVSAGLRGTDDDAMNGTAVMFAPGRILTLGGAKNYEDIWGDNTVATAHANIIDLNQLTGNTPKVTPLPDMHYARTFADAVALPDGKVFVVGGMQDPHTFTDATADLTPEMFNPATNTFTDMAQMQIARTYHSAAVLMQDGRVFVAGGGLCADSCDANHSDAQIYTPPYLLNAQGALRARPVITSAPSKTTGNGMAIRTATHNIKSMVLIRVGADTHSVDTDQREIPVSFKLASNGAYSVTFTSDRGVRIPGNYLFFVLYANGTPSIGKIINMR